MHALSRRAALAAVGFVALAAAPAYGQAERDSLPLIREVVRAIHVGLESQRGAPWFRDSPVLLVHAIRPPGGQWGTDAEIVPPGLPGVPIRACGEGCAAERPAEIRLTFLRIGYRGDRHAEVEVEASGMHGKHRDVPAHGWRSLTLYRLELHGGEWIAVRAEPIRGS